MLQKDRRIRVRIRVAPPYLIVVDFFGCLKERSFLKSADFLCVV